MGPSGQQGPLESSMWGCREEEAVCKNSCTRGSISVLKLPQCPQSALGESEPAVLRRDPASSQHSQASPASLSSQNHSSDIPLGTSASSAV